VFDYIEFRSLPVIGVVIGVLLAAVAVLVVVIVGLRRHGQSDVHIARKLAAAPQAELPAMERSTAAAVLIGADGVASTRLGRFALATLAPPEPASGQAGLKRELRAIENGLTELDRRIGTFSAAASCLAAAAGPQAQQEDAVLGTVLTELAAMPHTDIKPEELAGIVARMRAAHVPAPAQAPASDGFAKWAAAAMRPADPHAAAKAGLLAEMSRLGLDTEWPGLPGWPEYSRQAGGYDEQLGSITHHFAQQVRSARERAAAALEAAIRPDLLSQDGLREAERLARELQKATEKYSREVRLVMSAVQNGDQADAAAVIRRLDAVPALLARCDEQLGRPDAAAAIAVLATAGLPVASSWPPSREYQATWERASARLQAIAGQCPQQTARAVAKAAGHLQRQASQLGAGIESAAAEWRQQEDAAWAALESASYAVKRSAAVALCDPAQRHDAAEPVRASAAVICVDELAARNLTRIVRNAIPQAESASGDTDDQLRGTDKLFAALDRNAAVLSGIDGLIVSALAMTGADSTAGLAAAMTQLTPMDEAMSQAFHDAVMFLHHPLAGVTLAGSVEGFIHGVEHVFQPGWETMLMNLAMSDSPFGDITLFKLGFSGVKSAYLSQVTKTPLVEHGQQQLEIAAHHGAHAAALAAPDLLHGFSGHVPFVTLALSTTREIRLYRDGKTTADRALVNVAVDTGGVFAGFTLAELGVHAIAGAHPGGIIQIPATVLGSIVARKTIGWWRQRPYKEALERYTALTERYPVKAVEWSADWSVTAHATVERERSVYLANIGLPEFVQAANDSELRRLATELRVGTVSYAKSVSDLLNAGMAVPASWTVAGAADVIEDMDEVPAAADSCDSQVREGEYASALLTLTKTDLPAPDAWRPSREYRELCGRTAARIGELADRNRADVARWATDSAAEFRKRNAVIGMVITAKSEAISQERAAMDAEIDEARQALQREADRIGKKH